MEKKKTPKRTPMNRNKQPQLIFFARDVVVTWKKKKVIDRFKYVVLYI